MSPKLFSFQDISFYEAGITALVVKSDKRVVVKEKRIIILFLKGKSKTSKVHKGG